MLASEVRAHEAREACFPFSPLNPSKRQLEDARALFSRVSASVVKATKALDAATTPDAKAKALANLAKVNTGAAVKAATDALELANRTYVIRAREYAKGLPDPLRAASDDFIHDLGAALTYRWFVGGGSRSQWSSPECVYWTAHSIVAFSPRLAQSLFDRLGDSEVSTDSKRWVPLTPTLLPTLHASALLNRLLLLTSLWGHLSPLPATAAQLSPLPATAALLRIFDGVLMPLPSSSSLTFDENHARAFRDMLLVHNSKGPLSGIAPVIMRRLATALVQRKTSLAAANLTNEVKAVIERICTHLRQCLSVCMFTVLHTDLVAYGYPKRHELPPLLADDAKMKETWDAFKREDPATATAVRALVTGPLNDKIVQVWAPASKSPVSAAEKAALEARANGAKDAIAALGLGEKELTVVAYNATPRATANIVVVPDADRAALQAHRAAQKAKPTNKNKLPAYLTAPTYKSQSEFLASYERWKLLTT